MTLLVRILRTIIRNDAMREDPHEIYGWRVFALVFSACFGGMLFGWDTGAIGGVLAMDATKQKFGYDTWRPEHQSLMTQNIVSTLQAGCFAACFVVGWLADRFGRRLCLMGTGMLTTVGVVFQAASAVRGDIGVMYAGRFIAGLGVGAASSLVPLYVSECAPRAIRGALTSFYQLFIVKADRINYGCLLHVPAPAVYVIPLALQASMLGLGELTKDRLLIIGMFYSPESPRWCAWQKDWDNATEIIVKLRGYDKLNPFLNQYLDASEDSDYVQAEIREMASQLEAEQLLIGGASFKTLLKEMVKGPGNLRRAVISVFLMICQQMTGVNAVNYYAPYIFLRLGMSGTDISLFATGIYGVVKVVACACFLAFFADSLGRRRSLLWTSAAQGIVMFIIGSYGRVDQPTGSSSVSTFGWVAITCIYLWAAFFQFGWGPVCWILVSEIPTARLRALNVALAAGTQWLFNFVIARTVLTMQDTMGPAGYGMFFMFGGFDFLMGIFVWFCVPETKGLSLEKMDELFGAVNRGTSIERLQEERLGGHGEGEVGSRTSLSTGLAMKK